MASSAVLSRATRMCWRSGCTRSHTSLPVAHASRQRISPSLSHSSLRPSPHPATSASPLAAFIAARSFASASSASAVAVASGADSAAAGPSDQAAIAHFLSSLPTSLVELAPKFTSWPHLIHASSRQLKALGLAVKQRKALLYHTELYKARQRRREMLDYLALPDTRSQSASSVQQGLYDVAYAAVYARQWKRAEEREAQHWWRQATEMNRMRKSFIRNQWNGVQVETNPESIKPLRNPELMKERLKAEIAHLQQLEADGKAELIDQLDLFEHYQLQDENIRADSSDTVDALLEDMEEDEELREATKAAISSIRQQDMLDTKQEQQQLQGGDSDAADATEEAEVLSAEEQQDRDAEGEQDDDDDEEGDELSQAEEDDQNPYMEDGMDEEQKEDARLELAVDQLIHSDETRALLTRRVEMEVADYDADQRARDDYDADMDEIEDVDDEDEYDGEEDGDETAHEELEGAQEDELEGDDADQTDELTAPDAADSTDVDGAADPSPPSAETAAARQMERQRRERKNLAKLFSYSGHKAE